MTQNSSSELRDALEHIWGGGIDYALSPDFKDLADDEKDALYIRYRDNLIAKAEHLIDKEVNKARINELENWRVFLGADKVIASELDERIKQLTNREDGYGDSND